METLRKKLPLLCLVVSILRLLTGKLKISRQYIGSTITVDDGQRFTIFRHVTIHPLTENKAVITFIVRFKFARLSYKANKLASIIPMLLITGFPGFEKKMYAVNKDTGFWQGMYQWKSREHLQDYENSFVYRMMNKRAIKDSISVVVTEDITLANYLKKHESQ